MQTTIMNIQNFCLQYAAQMRALRTSVHTTRMENDFPQFASACQKERVLTSTRHGGRAFIGHVVTAHGPLAASGGWRHITKICLFALRRNT